MNKIENSGVLLLAIIILAGCTVVTGMIVHHNDMVSANRAMMLSDAMEKKAVAKAAETAAMQQEAKDNGFAGYDDVEH